MTDQTRPGDELVASLNGDLDVVVDTDNHTILRCKWLRFDITDNLGDLAQALLKARLIAEARELRPETCVHLDNQGRPYEPAPWAHARLHDGDLATCGHPANADGECDCSTWPERNPSAYGSPLCICCGQPAGVPHRQGTIGDVTGPLCADCAHWLDGNITPPSACEEVGV